MKKALDYGKIIKLHNSTTTNENHKKDTQRIAITEEEYEKLRLARISSGKYDEYDIALTKEEYAIMYPDKPHTNVCKVEKCQKTLEFVQQLFDKRQKCQQIDKSNE